MSSTSLAGVAMSILEGETMETNVWVRDESCTCGGGTPYTCRILLILPWLAMIGRIPRLVPLFGLGNGIVMEIRCYGVTLGPGILIRNLILKVALLVAMIGGGNRVGLLPRLVILRRRLFVNLLLVRFRCR